MVFRPILLLPKPALPVKRANRSGGPGNTNRPGPARQRERLAPRFAALAGAMERRRLSVQSDPSRVSPEQVIVLETAEPVEDFMTAVQKIPGLEWLGEIEDNDIPPDEDFFNETNREKPLRGRMYLTLTNQQALRELLSLWKRYTQQKRLGEGFTPFEELFGLLRDVRPWSSIDRLESTGVLDDWRERVAVGQDLVRCEVELWYRRDPAQRASAASRLRTLLHDVGGTSLQHVTLDAIGYDAMLADLPIAEVQRILVSADTNLVQCEDVHLFAAVGQAMAPVGRGELETEEVDLEDVPAAREPVVALLDGLPLQQHEGLSGRLLVDDPDHWEESYPAVKRRHGTAMASLILHGDLAAGERCSDRRLYVRPLLRADRGDVERVPEETLLVDFVHRAVRRIVIGDGDEAAAAPNVCIVNLAVGDRDRPFDRVMSPLARLLDYLAQRYGLLFIVSAGNWSNAIELEHEGSLADLDGDELGKLILQSIAADNRNRRLLSPAEGLNVLTVAGSHRDACGVEAPAGWREPYETGVPSPFNAQGMGYRRSIKPDILMPSGRAPVRPRIAADTTGPLSLEVFEYSRAPGARVACPGSRPGELAAVCHMRGTSVGTALTARAAARVYDVVEELRHAAGGEVIEQAPPAVWIRTLLVHAADWARRDIVDDALKTSENTRQYREYVTRVLGYGEMDVSRLAQCTDHRVTVLGGGELDDDHAHVHRFPLPPSLAGKTGWRRLTITLTYFSPVNPFHRSWRRAQIWFNPPTDRLAIKRTQADWQAAQRGTLQHEILEGDKADAYVDGASLKIKVSCRAEGGVLVAPVPYALAVTLEVAPSIGVPIYEEIEERIRLKVKPRT